MHLPAPRPAPPVRVGLSGKLLLLTIVFVMVAEVLIYVPSIANFRLNWLNDRLAAGACRGLGARRRAERHWCQKVWPNKFSIASEPARWR